jgi:hypothetical protein
VGGTNPVRQTGALVDSPEPLRRRGEELHESCRKARRSRILPRRIRAASSRLVGEFGGEREDTPFGVLGELIVRRVRELWSDRRALLGCTLKWAQPHERRCVALLRGRLIGWNTETR